MIISSFQLGIKIFVVFNHNSQVKLGSISSTSYRYTYIHKAARGKKEQIEAHNSMFEHKSKEYKMLCTYFRHPRTMMDEKLEYLTTSEILDHISSNSPKFIIEHSAKIKIGQALIKQNYKTKVCHADCKYAVCRLNNTAVNYIQKYHPQSVYDKEYDYYIPLEVIKATERASVAQILMVRDQLKGEEKTQ